MKARVWHVLWGSALAFASVALAAPVAAADDELFRLSWVRLSGAESCPAAEQIAAAVRARLGRDPFSNEAPRNIEGSVARVGESWHAELKVLGADGSVLGTRDLAATAPDCSVIADAAILAVALTIDPRASLAPPDAVPAAPQAPPVSKPPESPPDPAPPVAETPKPATIPPVSRSPAPAPAPGVATAVRGLLGLGLLPSEAIGAELSAAIPVASRFRLTTTFSFFPEVRTADESFGFGITAGGFGLCAVALDGKRAQLAACAELQAGAIHVVVYEGRSLDPGDHLWLATRLGPRLGMSLARPVELELGTEAVLPLIRHQFAVEGAQDPFFQSDALGFLATAGLRVSIP